MFADPTRRKFIIAGVIVFAFVLLIGIGSFITEQTLNPRELTPRKPIHIETPSKKPIHIVTPKRTITTYPLVKLAEVSGRISGLGENDGIVIYISWSWPLAEGNMAGGASFSHFGNGNYRFTPPFRIEPGEEPENLTITIKPVKVPEGLKPDPKSYNFFISRGEIIENVNFRFSK